MRRVLDVDSNDSAIYSMTWKSHVSSVQRHTARLLARRCSVKTSDIVKRLSFSSSLADWQRTNNVESIRLPQATLVLFFHELKYFSKITGLSFRHNWFETHSLLTDILRTFLRTAGLCVRRFHPCLRLFVTFAIKLVYTIFWKRLNRLRCKLARVVYRSMASKGQLLSFGVKRSKVKFTRGCR